VTKWMVGHPQLPLSFSFFFFLSFYLIFSYYY
jgi:hypothetical protein